MSISNILKPNDYKVFVDEVNANNINLTTINGVPYTGGGGGGSSSGIFNTEVQANEGLTVRNQNFTIENGSKNMSIGVDPNTGFFNIWGNGRAAIRFSDINQALYIPNNVRLGNGLTINMLNGKIIELGNPTNGGDATNKFYVDTSIQNAISNIPPSDSLTTNLNMNNNLINNLSSPLSNNDATNKLYVDTSIQSAISNIPPNDSLNTNLNMNNNLINNLGAPVNPNDAVNKSYVDNAVSNIPASSGVNQTYVDSLLPFYSSFPISTTNITSSQVNNPVYLFTININGADASYKYSIRITFKDLGGHMSKGASAVLGILQNNNPSSSSEFELEDYLTTSSSTLEYFNINGDLIIYDIPYNDSIKVYAKVKTSSNLTINYNEPIFKIERQKAT